MSSATHVLTLEEALALPIDALEEVVNGEIRKMPPRENAHAALIEELVDILGKQLSRDNYRIRTTAYGLGIRTEPTLAARNPDLTVFDREQLKSAKGYVWVPPKLVVECLSPSNRKGSIHQLLLDYETARVSEVWLLDPRRTLASQYTMLEGELTLASTVKAGELRCSSLPIAVDVGRLWHVFETGD